ncbi:MAG: ABC transporter permease subunit [Salana multivorans]|nr:ABC transporter permease subunit [Salana multivorans]OJX94831.1 MAG: hypothetical protein BGO96_00770 [Micrococcales bacterium 73-15]
MLAPTPAVLIAKVIGLGLVLSAAIVLTPTLIALENWFFLVAIWAIAISIVAVYLTGRAVPLKYLLPGALLLIVLTIYPILLTIQTSTTNYGDGTRSTKAEAVATILGNAAVPAPDARTFTTAVGTQGSTTTGPFSLLLVDQATDKAYAGDPEGLVELDDAVVENGVITEAPGYTLLTKNEINPLTAGGGPLDGFVVPAGEDTVIKLQGFNAMEMRTPLLYDEDADTITNVDTGVVYTPQRSGTGDRSYFTADDGTRLSNQSWGEDVGMFNYKRLFTDSRITGPFLSIAVWTLVFAVTVVASTYFVGLLLAISLNDDRLRFLRFFRSVIILPYAIPGFILLMVWASFWNRDFGLVNNLLGLNIDWLQGSPFSARAAVLLTQLWMGFPYMFLICTGALQSVPSELKEAASIDGATGVSQFWRIIFPLVLVSTAPLLVASFAFNFNNFNAIQLLTQGGPFTADNPTAGGTDILVSYTYRLAFGGVGEQIGFASAVSVLLFILTAVIAAIQFRGTRKLEEIY